MESGGHPGGGGGGYTCLYFIVCRLHVVETWLGQDNLVLYGNI